jgi:hypothetical protein
MMEPAPRPPTPAHSVRRSPPSCRIDAATPRSLRPSPRFVHGAGGALNDVRDNLHRPHPCTPPATQPPRACTGWMPFITRTDGGLDPHRESDSRYVQLPGCGRCE